MKNLFDAARVEEVKQRIARLRPDSQRQWGKMNAPQAVAHCSRGLELALGDLRPPRVLLGRIMGPIIKPKVCARLYGLIDRFVAAGPKSCTTHPHSFFGPLTPEEWAILMYKHLDHHLRQFGV